MKLIDKAALVAEINSMLKSVEHTSHCDETSFNSGRWKALISIKNFLDTLEVKEVDFEKEYKDFINSDNGRSMFETAKHFFGLGLKAQKEK